MGGQLLHLHPWTFTSIFIFRLASESSFFRITWDCIDKKSAIWSNIIFNFSSEEDGKSWNSIPADPLNVDFFFSTTFAASCTEGFSQIIIIFLLYIGYDWSLFRHYTVLWTIRIKWIFNSLQMRYKCCMVTFWGGIRKKVKPDVTPYYTIASCHWNYSVLWYPKYKVDIAHPSSYKSIL